ncbi:energy-coupling factor ABC transporter ATP-binding protein [Virgibacillus soli]|uniref:ABC transporter ATP-binding protein n=1 Tax=Paracerasibacillus soli TaxID=480284 RepID=A0ABU5CQC1_9BACI|nr:ABC transporter ATP-binding protein [Virgibacillus soli]MDY0407648.1 ABC transporter ATP-binding protein [Virgibacillus soli]
MSMIQVEGLKYRYPDTDKLAIHDVSFTIEKGEFIGIIGRNTAGKSTLCYALSGLVPHFFKGAYGGKVIIDGVEVRQSDMNEVVKKIGLVFDNPFSQMTGSKYTVFDEIAFGLENLGIDRGEMVARIERSLELLEITNIREKNPFDLSGGQMQRVAIASVVAMKPTILILDEPTSQLDPQGSDEVFKVVENLAKEGITIMMAEQKMEKLAQYADRVLLLDDGKLIDFATPEKIFSRDDLYERGVEAPVVTNVAKALGIYDQKTGLYPATLQQLKANQLATKTVLRKLGGHGE